jgi:hypothetical protein
MLEIAVETDSYWNFPRQKRNRNIMCKLGWTEIVFEKNQLPCRLELVHTSLWGAQRERSGTTQIMRKKKLN